MIEQTYPTFTYSERTEYKYKVGFAIECAKVILRERYKMPDIYVRPLYIRGRDNKITLELVNAVQQEIIMDNIL